MRSRFAILGITAGLVLAACGDTEPTATPDDDLLPPVPVSVVGSNAGAAAAPEAGRLAADTTMTADSSIAADSSFMPFFGGFVYEIGDDLGPLPTDDIAYQFVPGGDVDAGRVSALGAALGVEGEPVRGGGTADGLLWRIGPDDGSAPSLTVLADAQLSWYYSSAWQVQDEIAPDEIVRATECLVPLPGDPVTNAGTPDVGTSAGAGADPATAGPSDGSEPVPAVSEDCPEPEPPTPPAGVPTAEEARGRADEILRAVGEDPARFELETFADEWFASVNAFDRLGSVRSPMSWGFGFGGEGVLEWAGGSLATPVATGPYPLIDLDAAITRLTEQSSGWFGGTALPEPVILDDTATGDAATDATATDASVTEELVDPVPGRPAEDAPAPEPELAVLVSVTSDLWWAWDDDGTIWLLPAYHFTDSESRQHVVPAVTDEYLVIPEPVEEPMIEPGPAPDEAPPVEPTDDRGDATLDLDVEQLVGLATAEAEVVVADAGGTLRVLRLDGEDLAGTMDFVPTRVNVAVVDGVVTEILSLG